MDSMIKDFIINKKATMLCSGPMSKNCIDASLELSQQFNVPQVLVASRRQIDSEEFGGGYVENFSTENFVNYVKNKNVKKIFLARDHGGPGQGEFEKIHNLDLHGSMQVAKKSFENDILSGLDFLHIDPSIPIQNETLTIDNILNRLFELYGHVNEYAQIHNKKIEIELGTEEQNGYTEDAEKFEYFLNKVMKFCDTNKIIKPTFIVAQTGTRVMETKNIGQFSAYNKPIDAIDTIIKTLQICEKYDVMLKEHNADYLSSESLSLRPLMGIHASNVAPEFGVIETKGLFYLLNTFGYKKELDLFIEVALSSEKWKKWMLKDSQTSNIEKAVICGHYIFANAQIKQMKEKISCELLHRNINVDEYLKTLVKQSMLRYMQLFKML